MTHLPDKEATTGATAEPARMHELTLKDWMTILRRWEPGEPPSAEEWMQHYGHHLKAHPCHLGPMTGAELWRILRRTKDGTSTGSDAWRGAEVKVLPERMLDPFGRLMWRIEHGAAWPRALLYAIVAMLAKAGQNPLAAGPLKQRPVSIASVLYRAYASVRYRQLSPWMMSWCHENFRGGVPEGDCKDLTVELGLDIEAAALDGEALWGLDEDVKKYYDSLVREILWAASEKLGLPEWFVDSQRRFYNELQRCFKYGSALGPWFRTLVSVLQGCALSQIWANVDGSCWAWEIQEKAKVQVGGSSTTRRCDPGRRRRCRRGRTPPRHTTSAPGRRWSRRRARAGAP